MPDPTATVGSKEHPSSPISVHSTVADRRQTLKLLGEVVRNRSRQMGSKNPKGGISHSLLYTAPSLKQTGITPAIHAGSGQERIPCNRNQGNGREGSDRDRTRPQSGLLQPDFPGPKIRKQVEANNRSLGSKLPHTVPNLQDGNLRVHSQVGPKGPVAYFSRSQRCVFPYTHPSRKQEVSSIPPSRHTSMV